MIKRAITAIVAGVFLLTSCTSQEAKYINLDVTQFANKVIEPKVVILDVRTPGEFASGHIVGAINIDAESGNFESEVSTLDKKLVYAVYCRSGRRSTIAVEKMVELGFTNLYNLNGGTIDWESAGQILVLPGQ
jgi:rhodanese-related sulfurtransferase